jgi:hypothetical protein
MPIISSASEWRWNHPDTNERLDPNGLISLLGRPVAREFSDNAKGMAKGLDLPPRPLTKKHNAQESLDGPIRAAMVLGVFVSQHEINNFIYDVSFSAKPTLFSADSVPVRIIAINRPLRVLVTSACIARMS